MLLIAIATYTADIIIDKLLIGKNNLAIVGKVNEYKEIFNISLYFNFEPFILLDISPAIDITNALNNKDMYVTKIIAINTIYLIGLALFKILSATSLLIYLSKKEISEYLNLYSSPLYLTTIPSLRNADDISL